VAHDLGQLARRGRVRDFRSIKRFKLDGAEGVLSQVPQGTEYPEAAVTEGSYTYSVAKYGRRIPFLWEVFVNDDLDALRDMPDRLAKAARMTEERFATEVYVDSTGPDATFFAAGNNNLATGAGSALSLANLQAAFGTIWQQKDADGNPIMTGQLRLVVPPQLAVLARNILNATEIRNSPVRVGGGVVGTEDGSFETDGIDYKVRHVFGGVLIEPKAAYAAQGS
jgi:hypothetical protein